MGSYAVKVTSNFSEIGKLNWFINWLQKWWKRKMYLVGFAILDFLAILFVPAYMQLCIKIPLAKDEDHIIIFHFARFLKKWNLRKIFIQDNCEYQVAQKLKNLQ
jgi:hypothetical protein